MATSKIVPGKSYGFFTDTSVCIGCKACEVACKEWNQLPSKPEAFLGDSLDNTGTLDGQTWRHVKFIDNVPDETMGVGDGKAFLRHRLHPVVGLQRLSQLHCRLSLRCDRHRYGSQRRSQVHALL
jgi:ferredoxin